MVIDHFIKSRKRWVRYTLLRELYMQCLASTTNFKTQISTSLDS